MSGSGSKIMNISVDVTVPEDMTPEQLADSVESALGQKMSAEQRAETDFSNLTIRTIPRDFGVMSAGYDNRLWEKATCP